MVVEERSELVPWSPAERRMAWMRGKYHARRRWRLCLV